MKVTCNYADPALFVQADLLKVEGTGNNEHYYLQDHVSQTGAGATATATKSIGCLNKESTRWIMRVYARAQLVGPFVKDPTYSPVYTYPCG